MESYIFSAILGYLIGSVPTAYLVLKLRRGIDIRENGSGNVGTLNSYEVSNSKKIGLFVLVIDLLKGFLSVLIVKIFLGNEFLLQMTSLLFAVLAHCYSIWLKFKGGRGLATAAGGLLFFSPGVVIIWATTWYVIHKLKKDIHLANILASIIIIALTIFISPILNNFSYPSADSNFIFGFCLSLLMVIILSKHWEPLKLLLNKK